MKGIFDRDFSRKLYRLRESLLPYLKGRVLLEESPLGQEVSPEPDSPRGYAQGDDIRYIDWNLYARLDRLFVKSMVREEEVPHLILPDISGSMVSPDGRKLRLSLELAAALADIHLSLGHPVYLAPWAEGLKGFYGPYHGEGDAEAVRRRLETLEEGGRTNLRRSLLEMMPLGPRRAAPIIISDFLFPLDYQNEIGHLGVRMHGLASIQVLSRAETDFRLRGNLVLVDPETLDESGLHAGYALHKAYHDALRDHLRDVEDFFGRSGKVFLRALSHEPFDAAVGRYFARAQAFP